MAEVLGKLYIEKKAANIVGFGARKKNLKNRKGRDSR